MKQTVAFLQPQPQPTAFNGFAVIHFRTRLGVVSNQAV